MARVTLAFREEQPVTLDMDVLPRVGDLVNDEKVKQVDWSIYEENSETTYSAVVSFEEPKGEPSFHIW